MKIVRNRPADRWGEALPVGNGHIGAMVHGSLPKNRIQLSENTFYSGSKSDHNNQKDADQAFYRMRSYASNGEYDKVQEEAEKFIGVRGNYGTNLPVGELLIDFGVSLEEITGYERSLDIINGITECSFIKDGQEIMEELFISNPDHILIDHIHMNGDGNVGNVMICFQPANEYGSVIYGENTILFTCYAYETMHCDEVCGSLLVGFASIMTDGTCIVDGNGLAITGASDIRIYLDIATDFKRDYTSKVLAVTKLKEEVMKHVAACMGKNYLILKERHEKDIRNFMERVDFRLDEKEEHQKLLPVLFQYGRYLLLSSSREDSKLPAHLQGIWNDNVACRIGWTCDMHLDINTQMNYWPSEVTDLGESVKPLFRWIKEDLSKEGARAAKESYGLYGWIGELVSNAWGFAAPYWASPIAPCPTGGVWIQTQMWEHYLYTGDQDFLINEAFPLIEGSVRFFHRYVFREDSSDYYTCGPSISPENSFLYQEKPYQISNGCTYELLMIRELFSIYLAACDIIKDYDIELQQEVHEKLMHLLPYRITKDGTIAEWNHDLEQADVQHRHTSHLLGLFPFSQITPEETPKLCEAVKRTLKAKLTPIENWEDTGWARSMLMLYEARLCDGNKAYEHIKSMMDNLLEPNLMVYHPPTRGAGAFDHVYELDGNTGLTSCIAEMLLQSHKNKIRLLPALPEEWKSGKISGLRARGGITVDISWDNGKLDKATLTAKQDGIFLVSYANKNWELTLKKGIPFMIGGTICD